MKRTLAKSIEQHSIIEPGEYDGLWSGYYVEVVFKNGKKSQPIKVNMGVRGINCECKVEVDSEGWVYAD